MTESEKIEYRLGKIAEQKERLHNELTDDITLFQFIKYYPDNDEIIFRAFYNAYMKHCADRGARILPERSVSRRMTYYGYRRTVKRIHGEPVRIHKFGR